MYYCALDECSATSRNTGCLNGGSCVMIIPGSFSCSCRPGFTGSQCQTGTGRSLDLSCGSKIDLTSSDRLYNAPIGIKHVQIYSEFVNFGHRCSYSLTTSPSHKALFLYITLASRSHFVSYFFWCISHDSQLLVQTSGIRSSHVAEQLL